MGKFIVYTILGTLATFAVILHWSLLPYLQGLPSFAGGISPAAVQRELPSFLTSLALSWIIWWSVSGMLSLILLSVGKYTWFLLFILSLGAVCGITVLIT